MDAEVIRHTVTILIAHIVMWFRRWHPVGFFMAAMVTSAVIVSINSQPYYYGGTFYSKEADGYKVIVAPDGAVVANVPEGAEEVDIEDQKYVFYNETYFQSITQDGKDVYQIVAMESAD